MEYVFTATETGTPSGNEAETKALLHMLDATEDGIELFAVDCFNDVTGMDNPCFVLHDAQSKAEKNTSPAKLGRYLVTLLENHLSEFSQFFDSLTLFVGGVSKTVLQNPELVEFGFHDIEAKAQKKVQDSLIEECKKRKNGIDDNLLSEDNINDFLSKVHFVIFRENREDYIKPLVRTSAPIMPDSKKLKRIFTEIRDKQSALKNRAGIAGKRITHPDRVIDLGRVVKRRDIELLVIQRILNRDFLRDDTPKSFIHYLNQIPDEEDPDAITEDCRHAIYRQFFDKNNSEAFWTFLDEVVTTIDNSNQKDIEEIYDQLKVETRKACTHLERRSCLYFIATIKDGLYK